MHTERIVYNDKVVRQFIWASIIFGLVGMLVGALIALQLAAWQFNLPPWLSFGRLRPLHTNAVIFAFVGNMLFAGVYHSTQRLVKARLASDRLSSIHFWGWQLIIVAAAITLPLGLTQSKEYAELIWPIDLAVAVVWLVFGANFFWTLARRNEKHLYVAIWFYIATIVTITVLYVVNNLSIPSSLTHSYPGLLRCSGCARPVVVWPQRGRLLPHHPDSRDHVLLLAESGGPTGFQLPAFDHSLLGAGLPLHLGRAAPPLELRAT